MNKEQTIEAIAVMQAYVDGAEIEWCSEGYPEWSTTIKTINKTPMWSWTTVRYRIKPKPREFYLNIHKDGSTVGYGHKTREAARDACADYGVTIKVREVMSDD